MRALTAAVAALALSFSGLSLAQDKTAGPVLSTTLSTAKDSTQKHHTKYVNLLEFSADGNLLASGSTVERVVRLWDVKSGKLLKELSVEPLVLNGLALSHDGKRIAITARDRNNEMLQIWDTASGTKITEKDAGFMLENLQYHTSGIYAWASPDWSRNRKDHQLLVLSPTDASIISKVEMPGANGTQNAITYTTDGQFVVAGYFHGDNKHTLGVWEASSGRQALRLTPNDMRTAAVSYDSSKLAIGKSNGVDLVAFNGTPIRTLGQGLTRAVAFSPNGVFLASGIRNGTISLFSVDRGSEMSTEEGPKTDVTRLVFSPDSTLLAATWGEGTIRLYNTADGKFAKFSTRKAPAGKKKK